MKHSFTIYEELDTPVAIAVGAYLDCEHYVHLHKSMSGKVEITKVEGRRVTVRQSWKWLGFTMGHEKTGEYFPPARFVITDVNPSPSWMPSIHHFLKIKTILQYTEIKTRKSTLMRFDVELEMPFWLFPLRRIFQKMIEKMHAQQNKEDMDCLRYRAKLYGRENNSAYLASYQFLYHKDEYIKWFGPQSELRSVPLEFTT